MAPTRSTTASKREAIPCDVKLANINTVNKMLLDGKSLRKSAIAVGRCHTSIIKWKRKEAQLEKARPGAKSLCQGRRSVTDGEECVVLEKIYKQRVIGKQVSKERVRKYLDYFSPAFRAKPTRAAKMKFVNRFLARHDYVLRTVTHKSVLNRKQSLCNARSFITMMYDRMTCVGRHNDYILNMDQTPIFFSMHANKTIERKGKRIVFSQVCCNASARITVALTVTASGKTLPPYIIFQGAPGGRIESEFDEYPKNAIYAVQKNAWMDEAKMLHWVEATLIPYCNDAPDGVVPLLLLDSYSCHQMPSVITAIESAGVELAYIPPGCTWLCQPIDVGLGRPYKDHVKDLWDDWLFEFDGEEKIPSPSREDLADWCVQGQADLPVSTLFNSWRHDVYNYFAPLPKDAMYMKWHKVTVMTLEADGHRQFEAMQKKKEKEQKKAEKDARVQAIFDSNNAARVEAAEGLASLFRASIPANPSVLVDAGFVEIGDTDEMHEYFDMVNSDNHNTFRID
jgi:DDE superfamily endonuclease